MAYNDLVSAFIHLFATLYLLYLLYNRRHSGPTFHYINRCRAAFAITLSGSTVYHFVKFLNMSSLIEVTRRVDHSLIALAGCLVGLAVNGLYFSNSINRSKTPIIVFATGISIILKLFFFQYFLGWYGFLIYVALSSLSLWILFNLYRFGHFHAFKFIILALAELFLAGSMERLGLFNLVPNFFGPHELFHVAILVGFWLLDQVFLPSVSPAITSEITELTNRHQPQRPALSQN